MEAWAQLFLCEEDSHKIQSFLVKETKIHPHFIVRNMHLTVYHARGDIIDIKPRREAVRIVLSAADTRFMVMVPGGENVRPDIDPTKHKVGIRVHRQSNALLSILKLRDSLLKYESASLLGNRTPSSHRRSAFGARHFQPHMTILKAGSQIERDLSVIGKIFREEIETLTFTRFTVEVNR